MNNARVVKKCKSPISFLVLIIEMLLNCLNVLNNKNPRLNYQYILTIITTSKIDCIYRQEFYIVYLSSTSTPCSLL